MLERGPVLKVQSSEMDPAEIRLIRQVAVKERGAVPTSCESPFKLQRHLVQKLAILLNCQFGSKAHTAPTASLV
jgi:hypothetical protein